MASVQYTDDQLRVINSRNVNLLVSAAAGSGKTAVLSERIISLITDKDNPIDVDRMLIVTFTKAAAAEMRERIGDNLSKRLAENPGDEFLLRQQTLLNNAQITTIDAFCLFVIRNNFADIDLDPDFRAMDEAEKKLMLGDCLRDILELEYQQMSEAFCNFVESYVAGGRDSKLEEMVLDIFNFVMSNTNPKRWLQEASKMYQINDKEDILKSQWWNYIKTEADLKLKCCKANMERALKICNMEGGPQKYRDIIQTELNLYSNALAHDDYETRQSYFGYAYDRIPSISAKDAVDGELKEAAKNLRDESKKIFQGLREKYYQADMDTLIADMNLAASNAEILCRLVIKLIDSYEEAKREHNLIDFNDMEHYALKILLREREDGSYEPTEAAMEYKQYFDIVMVDEYQDSNDVQELVLKSVARDNNYFMVGDVKQSIYRFRQAKPEIFMDKYNSFGSEGINTRIDLNKNFRSREEVLSFANAIFTKIMTRDTCGIDYDDNASLHLGADYYSESPEKAYYKPEILIYEEADDEENAERFSGEANMVADRICLLIKENYRVYDKDTKSDRGVRYRDIVILLRSMSGGADNVFKKALENRGIPAYAPQKTGYFDTMEVKEILNYLAVIDNPTTDIAMYGTLISFFGKMSKEDVIRIKSEGTLYEALNANSDDEKCKAVLNAIERYREMASYVPIRDLIECIIEDSGYMEYIGALPGGDRRKANVLMLLERAGDFEKSSFHGLFRFIRYIEELKAKEVDYGEMSVTDENADVVRIMTFHASKGLEFPVVFVSALSKNLNMQDSKATVCRDAGLGIGIDMIDPVLRVKKKTLIKNAIALKNTRDTIAEEMRVLYVALTRAREKLIVTASVNDYQKYEDKLPSEGTYNPVDVLEAKNYLDMVIRPLASDGQLASYVRLVSSSDLDESSLKESVEAITKKQALINDDLPWSQDFVDILDQRFASVYPYENLTGLYVKTTVSDIKHEHYEDEYATKMYDNDSKEAYVPRFASDSEEVPLGGAMTGTAYHRIMELIDYGKLYELCKDVSEDQFKEVVASFVDDTIRQELASGRLKEEYAKRIKADRVYRFFDSKVARRMMLAASKGKLYKEAPFFLGVKASEVNETFPDEELMLVQGVVDVYFEEDGQLVIVDYKTDRVSDKESLTDKYKIQLDYYAEALSRITGLPVSGEILYSFALADEVTISPCYQCS